MPKETKERKTDRILVLKPKEGQGAKSTGGIIDSRLFTGENALHAVQDQARMTWAFKYNAGGVPEPLKGRYTTFKKAYEAAKFYFDKRNVDIVEVID